MCISCGFLQQKTGQTEKQSSSDEIICWTCKLPGVQSAGGSICEVRRVINIKSWKIISFWVLSEELKFSKIPQGKQLNITWSIKYLIDNPKLAVKYPSKPSI